MLFPNTLTHIHIYNLDNLTYLTLLSLCVLCPGVILVISAYSVVDLSQSPHNNKPCLVGLLEYQCMLGGRERVDCLLLLLLLLLPLLSLAHYIGRWLQSVCGCRG